MKYLFHSAQSHSTSLYFAPLHSIVFHQSKRSLSGTNLKLNYVNINQFELNKKYFVETKERGRTYTALWDSIFFGHNETTCDYLYCIIE
jgi:phosphoribulokinase